MTDKYLKDKTKPRVRRRLTGDTNQCPSCGEFFNSSFAFGKHLIGEVATPARRCLTVQEMLDKGMAKKENGFWVSCLMDKALALSISQNDS